jgi:hypothetical protein
LVAIFLLSATWAAPAVNIRGDFDHDALITPLDVSMLIQYLYLGGAAPEPLWTGDGNCDSRVNIADLAQLINHVYRNGPELCTGGYALAFDGSNDMVEVAFQEVFNADAYTIEAWIKIDEPQVDVISSIVDRWTFNPTAQVWALWLLRDVPYTLRCGSGGSNTQGELTAGVLEADQWYHVACSRRADGLERLFLNGSEVGQRQFAAEHNTAATPLRFGHAVGGTIRGFYGIIDEVRIWNIARGATEIAATMNVPLAGTEPGLIGYWNFDEGFGDTAGDSSPTGADGRLGKVVGADDSNPQWIMSTAPVN